MTDSILKPMEQPAEAKRQRERSTIGFPYGDLDDGIAVAQAVHELGDRCSHEQLAPKLGHANVDSGTYGLKVAASRQFGLINVSKGEITLSPLGHHIVDPTQAEHARAEAFLAVPLYRALYEKCKGYTLPPNNLGLEAVLVELGVAEKQKDKARQALQRSADQAGFYYQGRDRLVMPAAMNRQSENQRQSDPPAVDPPFKNGGGGGGTDYPTLIMGMLEKLPKAGARWTRAERDQWLKAIALILEIAYDLEPEPQLLLNTPRSNVSPEA